LPSFVQDICERFAIDDAATAMGPMIPAWMMMMDSVSASERKVKKEVRMSIDMTVDES
jgi:hypothetical protein